MTRRRAVPDVHATSLGAEWGPNGAAAGELRETSRQFKRPRPDQKSRLATLSAFCWMNSRRGSTTSPI
ncbi:hypothetical protein, partial [Rhodovulum sp.]|uniref:hypothetical protein n=1 Tax=Rhodovulum sp. TaxID=34009 RepID=UPI00257ECA21